MIIVTFLYSFSLKGRVFEKLRVHDGLVWTEGLNKQIKMIVFNFSFLVWTAGPITCVNTVGRNKSLCAGA